MEDETDAEEGKKKVDNGVKELLSGWCFDFFPICIPQFVLRLKPLVHLGSDEYFVIVVVDRGLVLKSFLIYRMDQQCCPM